MKIVLTKSQKLLNALNKGARSVAYIKNKLDIPNPGAAISYLRKQGYQIITDDSGAVTKYAVR